MDVELEELRIAPVMTGGTSLAIWMGGATNELYRLARARVDGPADEGMALYRRLLDLTHRTARVDVITGTSAGGLNGTLLAAATYLELDALAFGATADTWLAVADIEALARPVGEADPPSLLKGDDYFAARARDVLTRWAASHPVPERLAPLEVDLAVTVTTVTPEARGRTDDFGEPINEVEHAHQLRFTPDQFGRDDWIEKLAIASRTSASIPGVFEPSFLPVGEEDARRSGRPDFGPHATFRTSRWAVDGGVVVNLPMTEALDRIFERYADAEVHRVLLYLCPTPSGFQEASPDVEVAPPLMTDALLTAVQAPRAEGVSNDIDAIRAHNLTAHQQADTRRYLRPIVDRIDRRPQTVGRELLDAYRERRSHRSVEDLLRGVQRRYGRLPFDRTALVGALAAAQQARYPASTSDLENVQGDWGWGIAGVEQALSAVLRLTSRLLEVLPPVEPATAGPSPGALVDRRAEVREVRAFLHNKRADLEALRRRSDAWWDGRFAALGPVRSAAELGAWAEDGYARWPGPAVRADTFARLADAHANVARLLLQLAPTVAALEQHVDAGAGAAEAATSAAGDARRQAVRSIVEEYRTLTGSRPADAGQVDARRVQHRLLAVHVAQTVAMPHLTDREQPVTLMQLSWNAPNGLDPERSPHAKLAGPELGRLGAFVKPSWRANDWFWGRMDAAHQLTLLLLDPARLRRVGASVDRVEEALDPLVELTDAARAELRTALAPGATATSLPCTTALVATEVQRSIARRELVRVADQVERSQALGGNEQGTSAFVRGVRHAAEHGVVAADQTAELVQQMRIGEQGLGDELGSNLSVRVASRLAAVAVNGLTGKHAGVPVVPSLLRPLRAPLHAANSLVAVMARSTPLARALTAFLLAASGAVVALALVDVDVPSGALAVATVLLVGLVVVSLARSGFWLMGTAVALVASVVGLTLVGSRLDSVVYDQPATPHEVDIPAGTAVRLGEGAVLDVVVETDDGPVDQDVRLSGDGVLTFRSGDVVAAGPQVAGYTAAWKRYGFLNPWSAGRVLLASAAVVGTLRLVRRGGTGRDEGHRRRQALRLLGVLGLVVGALALPRLAESVLTGAPGSSDGKDRVVDVAASLEGYGLEVVLVTVVGASALLAIGGDLWLRSKVAWARDRLRRRPPAGSAPLT